MLCTAQCDLYVATRSARDEPFENPQALDDLNTEFFEGGLSLTADQLEAYFISDRPGGKGGRDIWVATRTSVEERFTTFRNLKEVNTPIDEAGLSISADGLTLFWSDFPGGGASRPGGKGGADIWCAVRAARDEPFGEAVNLGSPINTSGNDSHLHLSPRWPEDGSLVYFSRCQDLNCADLDIYQATWHVAPPAPLFLGALAPSCMDAADANDDGKVDLSDAVFGFGYLFLGKEPPPSPGPSSCGPDPTQDGLPSCIYETTKC